MHADSPLLRFGLVGAGSIGSVHARIISQSLDAKLTCIIDPNRDIGQALADRYDTSWQPDVDSLARFDALIIASPTDTHFEWGMRALGEGTPILIEKPISADLGLTAELVDTAQRVAVPMTCGLVERFNPTVRTAMDIIREPIYIRAVRHSPYANRVQTGVAQDLLIHDVDLAICFANSGVSSVSATFGFFHSESKPEAEDIADATLVFDTGSLASLSSSRVAQRKVRTLNVATLNVAVEVDLLRQDITVYRHVDNMMLGEDGPGYRQETIIDIPVIQHSGEPLAAQFEHFVSMIRGEIDMYSELATLLPPHVAIDAAGRSAVSNGREVSIEGMQSEG